jgi:hypothetical protein
MIAHEAQCTSALFYVSLPIYSCDSDITCINVSTEVVAFLNCMLYLDSLVGIVTCYELDSSGIESQNRQDFLHLSKPGLVSSQHPVQWVLGLFTRSEAAGLSH